MPASTDCGGAMPHFSRGHDVNSPMTGDSFRVLCPSPGCDASIAVVTARHVTRLNFGLYQITTMRPGGTDPDDDRIEFVVDQSGQDPRGRVLPAPRGSDLPLEEGHARTCAYAEHAG